jgi:hypothetical protein
MILRWTAAGVLEAERRFRKIAGYPAIPKLVASCERMMPQSIVTAELIFVGRQPK